MITAKTPKDWDRLAAGGADAIITADPAALIRPLAVRREEIIGRE